MGKLDESLGKRRKSMLEYVQGIEKTQKILAYELVMLRGDVFMIKHILTQMFLNQFGNVEIGKARLEMIRGSVKNQLDVTIDKMAEMYNDVDWLKKLFEVSKGRENNKDSCDGNDNDI